MSCLQVAGCAVVIAPHSGVPGSLIAWTVVHIFFLLAGINMVSSLERDARLWSYARRRVSRFMPDYAILYVLASLVVLLHPAQNGIMFIASGWCFLNSWIFVASDRPPSDLMWAPLWFVSALLQLQLLAYLVWPYFKRLSAWQGLAWCGLVGVGGRVAYASITSGTLLPENIDTLVGLSLYNTPFAHVGALGLGLLIGSGKLTFRSGWMLAIPIGTLATGLLMCLWEGYPIETLGYPFGLTANWQYVWGYVLVAASCGVVVAPQGIVSRFINHHLTSPWLIRAVTACSGYTYTIYILHGTVAYALAQYISPAIHPWPRGLLIWLLTAILTTLLAVALKSIVTRLEGEKSVPGSRVAPADDAAVDTTQPQTAHWHGSKPV